MDSRQQRASGTVVDPRASLAMWLRTGRTQKNLSLEDVARITKIQPRILEKLETGNLEGLPADVFVKGFVRSFAKCCGLDEKEAIDRLGAAQSGQATTIAKAFVDSMSVRLVQATPPNALPVVLAESSAEMPQASSSAIAVVELMDLAPVAPITVAGETAVAETAVAETSVVETAPVVVVEMAVAESAPVEAAPIVVEAAEQPKKKRASRKKNPSAAPSPRSRKKKGTVSAQMAAVEAPVESSAAIELAAVEQAVIEQSVIEQSVLAAEPAVFTALESDVITSAPAVVASLEPTEQSVDIAIDDAAVEAPTLAEGSQRISASSIEVVDYVGEQILASDTIDSIETLRETDLEPVTDVAGTWQPTMPPLSTVASVPWRRPQLPAQSSYVVPHLVIDDADPDSADREREQRASREHSRLSFLPSILLEREDRSARQGGLTLAVIILLIAATLTLSYLMRRPSARGDGVTMQAGSSELLG